MSPLLKLYQEFTQGAPVCTDTRNITAGCIFFALKGENFNGNSFAVKAIEMGAAFAVVDEEIFPVDERIIFVNDVLLFLQQFATHHRMQFNFPFIGITGSNGKTTTKELVNRVLGKKYKTCCTRGNLNNHIGVPLTLLSLTAAHEIAIIEMGANHRHEIELLCTIARPTHVLITNVGKAHLEGFGGFEGVKLGKGEMYEYAKSHHSLVFINDDNSHLKEMLDDYHKTFRYGNSTSCDVTGKLNDEGSYVSLKWKQKNNPQWHELQTQITGNYNFENILSAIAAGICFDVNEDHINNAIATYIPDNQRSQEIIRNSHHIILDAYNANPTSMEAALSNFNHKFQGKRAVMLGDMFELGDSAAKEHQLISEMVASLHFDMVIFVGPVFKSVTPVKNAHYFENSSQASEWLTRQELSNYKILIKGSRGSKMEVILDAIK